VNADARLLYQEVILDHSRRPRNRRAIHAARRVESRNPACGDSLTLYLRIEDEVIREVSFEGAGCAISTASASLLTVHLEGKTLEQAAALAARIRTALSNPGAPEIDGADLAALASVRAFPARVECAGLAWTTLAAAADGYRSNDQHGDAS
jgi:nitrogen fixation NifU-like protein